MLRQRDHPSKSTLATFSKKIAFRICRAIGAAARIPGLDIAGKTGTAQTIANSKSEKGQDHAWFTAFAPVKNPEIVIVVLVERGGHGGAAAAPIARQILNAIFFEKVASVDIDG